MGINFLESKIDEIAGRCVSDMTPGFCILLAKEGVPLIRRAYGMSDVEAGIKIKPEDHFIIASNTKQFTCLAILILKERGLLDLDEPIERFFPDFPEYRKKVTVRMLMSHTSGIKEYFDDDVLEANEKFLRTAHSGELLDLAKSFGDKLRFEPDTDISYCNTAYVMLGDIVRQLSGKSFGQFIKTEIFDVLEMNQSAAPDYMDETDPAQVKGYTSGATENSTAVSAAACETECGETEDSSAAGPATYSEVPYDMLEVGYADGNISTNVDDILIWHNYLFNENDDRIVPYNVRKEMWTPHRLADGRETTYGMGIMTGNFDEEHHVVFDDRRELWHTGGTMGFISRISYFPDDKVSAVFLTNWEGIERDSIFDALVRASEDVLFAES